MKKFNGVGLLALLAVAAVSASAEEYSAILECKIEKEEKSTLIKISGNSDSPSWQVWMPDKKRWTENSCGVEDSAFGHKWRYVCNFSPDYYMNKSEFLERNQDRRLYGTGKQEINRRTGIYEVSEYSMERGVYTLHSPEFGYCVKSAEPVVPGVQF
ncbi:hypothetical protein [Luteimonas arsenica]|uniref:hypothetical protein n=1 Tax=Luteimonas arsenica TaxID=1586242 RepID=UPI0010551EEA|nr:hypothetical protein [Luteimonas arsenica]